MNEWGAEKRLGLRFRSAPGPLRRKRRRPPFKTISGPFASGAGVDRESFAV
jgi:hypothetical protein